MRADRLHTLFGNRLVEAEPLAKHVNIRLGGPADLYLVAASSDEIVMAAGAALADGVPFVVLGGGSNTLPSDEGFRGLVIQAANRSWSMDGAHVTAEAGVLSAFLARKTAEAGLTGFEWAISLPGTVGGAVRGNAGCFGGETKDALVSVEALRVKGDAVERIVRVKDEIDFGYRHSAFKANGEIVLSATFAFAAAPAAECLARIDAVLAQRKAEQPNASPSAGCMFKNFEYADDADVAKLRAAVDVPAAFLAARRIPAGWLVEQADLKGASVGGARVSEKHGNFLVNAGDATASDVVQLVSRVKTRVRDAYGLQLQEEVQLLGF